MLRLHSHGEQVLADWWASDSVTNADRYLVADVMLSVVDSGWQRKWQWYDDLADSTIRIIEPRAGLKLVIRMWDTASGVFDLIAIINEWRPH